MNSVLYQPEDDSIVVFDPSIPVRRWKPIGDRVDAAKQGNNIIAIRIREVSTRIEGVSLITDHQRKALEGEAAAIRALATAVLDAIINDVDHRCSCTDSKICAKCFAVTMKDKIEDVNSKSFKQFLVRMLGVANHIASAVRNIHDYLEVTRNVKQAYALLRKEQIM
ncbi:MAG: hypothetical protein QXG97_00730 [Nitrososphaerota archaeon]